MRIPASLVLSILLISCVGEKAEKSIYGKWAGVIKVEGINSRIKDYIELHIDSSNIFICSYFEIDRAPIRYTIEGDSLYYYDFDYSVGYKLIGDNVLVLSMEDQFDTLMRMDESELMYDEIERENNTELQRFYDNFYCRADSFYRSVGIEFEIVEDDTTTNEVFDFDMERIE